MLWNRKEASTEYARVKPIGMQAKWLKIVERTSLLDGTEMIKGFEVNKEGDHIRDGTWRLFVFTPEDCEYIKPAEMNLTYGELEVRV